MLENHQHESAKGVMNKLVKEQVQKDQYYSVVYNNREKFEQAIRPIETMIHSDLDAVETANLVSGLKEAMKEMPFQELFKMYNTSVLVPSVDLNDLVGAIKMTKSAIGLIDDLSEEDRSFAQNLINETIDKYLDKNSGINFQEQQSLCNLKDS